MVLDAPTEKALEDLKKKHLENADAPSIKHLEYVGDAALKLALCTYALEKYENPDKNKLSLVCSTNVSNETLARAAVRHRLHDHFKSKDGAMQTQVDEFVGMVDKEFAEEKKGAKREIYGGSIEAPKFLADVIERLVGAVYVDCEFDWVKTRKSIERLLGPMITLEEVKQNPNPITQLNEWRHDGKQCQFKFSESDHGKHVATVIFDGKHVAKASSNTRDNARLNAARLALPELPNL